MDRLLLMEREAFLKAYEDDNELEEGLRKGVVDVVKAVNVEERTVDTLISTNTVDRDRDTIDQRKWDLKAYRKNPVVQFAHDHHIPVIAQSTKVGVVSGKLATTDKFTPEGEHPFADMIFNLVKGRFIRAKSVGFKPERGKFEFDGERGGFDFKGQELLEHSYVNVPANPEALVGAKAAGIDLAPLIKWAEAVLDDDGRLWLPRETVERALKIAENERSVIAVNGWKLVPAPKDGTAIVIAEIEVDPGISLEDIEGKLDTTTLVEVQDMVRERIGQHKDPDEGLPDKTSKDGIIYRDVPECLACGEHHTQLKMIKLEEPLVTSTEGFPKHTIMAWGHCPVEIRTLIVDENGELHLHEKEVDEPAPDKGNALVSLLDSLPAQETKTEVTDEEVEFLGQALGEAIAGAVAETVRERLTAMTGKLD